MVLASCGGSEDPVVEEAEAEAEAAAAEVAPTTTAAPVATTTEAPATTEAPTTTVVQVNYAAAVVVVVGDELSGHASTSAAEVGAAPAQRTRRPCPASPSGPS